jgi:hypothetical protein
MDVSGIIERDELATALRLVSRGQGTGVLVASTAYANAQIGFLDGEVLWANSTMAPKLGELLVERGLVKRDKLDAALWIQKQDKEWRALGRVLVDVKLLARPVVELAIEAQITQVLDEMLRWDRGTFRFDAREPATCELILPPCRDLGQYELKVAMMRHQAASTGPAA